MPRRRTLPPAAPSRRSSSTPPTRCRRRTSPAIAPPAPAGPRRAVTVPPREARAFDVPAGHFFRIDCGEGPQVGDLNLWPAGDLSERFFSGKTRALHGTHLSTGDRLWSCLPHLRPMATITDDTPRLVRHRRLGAGGPRRDRHALRPLHHRLLPGGDYHHCCHSNLTARWPPTGLPLAEAEPHVHDVLNVFMCTGFTRDTGQYFMKASPVAARRLPRVLRRDRPPRRALGLSGRRLRVRAFERRRRLPSALVEIFAPPAPPAGWTPPRATPTARSETPSPSRIAARRSGARPCSALSPARRRSRSGRAPAIAARFSTSIPAIRSSMSPCRARW